MPVSDPAAPQAAASTASRRRLLAGMTAGAAALAGGRALGGAQNRGKVRLRIATDVNPQHLQTAALAAFAGRFAASFPDQVEIQLFHSGQLYGDRDLPRALMRGDLDLATPTLMTLSRIVPECGITSLPAFFARGAPAAHAVSDGELGQAMNRRIEARLGAVVAGPYLDLGGLDLFFTGRTGSGVRTARGLKVRVPSGAANVLRLRALGAYPVMLPFSDIPMALSQGAVDALESTAETIATGQLWDAGVRRCLRQEAVFVQYVPIFSGRFWRTMSPAMREAAPALWRATVQASRTDAVLRQEAARKSCAAHGVSFSALDPREARGIRIALEAESANIVGRLGIDPQLAARGIAIATGFDA